MHHQRGHPDLRRGSCGQAYHRFNRWSKRGRWGAIFEALAICGKHSVTLSIDSTSIKAHQAGGSVRRRSAAWIVIGIDPDRKPSVAAWPKLPRPSSTLPKQRWRMTPNSSALECKPAVVFGRAPDHITGYMAPHNSRAYAMLGPPLVLVPLCVNITGATETIVNP
jgi:hypothetical protein